MRKALGVLAVMGVLLTGCGSGGRSFGQAGEEWCSTHWPTEQESRCFETVMNRGPRFLESIEFQEGLAAELKGAELFHP